MLGEFVLEKPPSNVILGREREGGHHYVQFIISETGPGTSIVSLADFASTERILE